MIDRLRVGELGRDLRREMVVGREMGEVLGNRFETSLFKDLVVVLSIHNLVWRKGLGLLG